MRGRMWRCSCLQWTCLAAYRCPQCTLVTWQNPCLREHAAQRRHAGCATAEAAHSGGRGEHAEHLRGGRPHQRERVACKPLAVHVPVLAVTRALLSAPTHIAFRLCANDSISVGPAMRRRRCKHCMQTGPLPFIPAATNMARCGCDLPNRWFEDTSGLLRPFALPCSCVGASW